LSDTRKRRKHSRVSPKGVAAQVRSGVPIRAACALENLSAGGCFLRTTDPHPEGTALVLELIRPGMKKPLELPGRVVNRREAGKGAEGGMGICFDRLPPECSARLGALLEALGVDDVGDVVGWVEPPQPIAQITIVPTVRLDEWRTQNPGPDAARLLVESKGLAAELAALQNTLAARERQLAQARAEIARMIEEQGVTAQEQVIGKLKERLEEADEKIARIRKILE
jgi:hypothetical protein